MGRGWGEWKNERDADKKRVEFCVAMGMLRCGAGKAQLELNKFSSGTETERPTGANS